MTSPQHPRPTGPSQEHILEPTGSWRLSKDTATQKRVRIFALELARSIHVRLVRDWAAKGEGAYPTHDEAHRLAMAELGLLCRGLGEIFSLDPADLDRVAAQVRHEQRGADDDGFDLDDLY